MGDEIKLVQAGFRSHDPDYFTLASAVGQGSLPLSSTTPTLHAAHDNDLEIPR